jgi:type I restriction enzyme S subunit
MKKGWQTNKLGELLDIQNGYAFSSKDYSESGHFVIRIGNVQNGFISLEDPKFIRLPADGSLERFSLSLGDILVSLTGNVGRVGVIQKEHTPAALNQRVAKLCLKHDSIAIKQYLLHFLFSDRFREELSRSGHGSAQQNVSTKDIVEIAIPVPPLPEQQRIVALLDEAFAGLATAQAHAERNLRNARALFESHLNAVFTQRGEGWVDAILADILAVLRNGMNCKQDKSGVGSKISRIESIWNARFDITRVGYAEIPAAQKDKFLLKKGDVLFSHINSAIHVGKTALFDLEEEVVHGVNLLLMRARPSVLPAYLDLYLKHIFAAGYWLGVCKQSINQASVNQQDINRVPFRYPDLGRQSEIVGQLDDLADEIQRLTRLYEQKLAALAALKQSLLHQAFSGAL